MLNALDDPPEELAELRAVLLADHSGGNEGLRVEAVGASPQQPGTWYEPGGAIVSRSCRMTASGRTTAPARSQAARVPKPEVGALPEAAAILRVRRARPDHRALHTAIPCRPDEIPPCGHWR